MCIQELILRLLIPCSFVYVISLAISHHFSLKTDFHSLTLDKTSKSWQCDLLKKRTSDSV